MPSIKIQQYSFFLGIVCLRLKFAAKVLYFFQIHKKNYEKLLLFSNTTEKNRIIAKFLYLGIKISSVIKHKKGSLNSEPEWVAGSEVMP